MVPSGPHRFSQPRFRFGAAILLLAASGTAWAAEYRGVVDFGGLPVPGATVTITQGGKQYVTVTDPQGFYLFPALADGPASLAVEATGFAALKQEITVAAGGAPSRLELQLLSLDAMVSALKPVASVPFTEAPARSEPRKTGEAPRPAAKQPASAIASEELASRADEGLLVNGSVNNAATSQFSLASRFGNTASGRSLYSYSLNVRVENSALDARSYSLAGYDTGKPATNQLTGGFAVQGPLKIPHLLRNGPNVFLGYQRTENSIATTEPGLVPDAFERAGNFSQEPSVPAIHAPSSLSQACRNAGVTPGAAFAKNVIPGACISPRAQALISLYPLPNSAGSSIYNFQVPIVTDTHQDALNSNVSKTLGRKNQISGTLGAFSSRTSYQNLLGFTDSTSGLGVNSTLNWAHTYNAHLRSSLIYTYSHQSNRLTPYWENRANANVGGIQGVDLDPMFAGPPTLNFSSGIASLTDGQASSNLNQSNAIGAIVRWNHFAHNVTGGADFNRRAFHYVSQSNPRGTLSFSPLNSVSSGSDLADFLLGNPYTSQINYGNPEKDLRQSVYDAYVTDDWRVNPTLTVNAGVRWEYGAPVTETRNRLANLDVAPGFSAIASVQAPQQQLQPDRTGFEPRIGVSWRPIPGSSTLVSGGYGVTYDTSVYSGLALNLAEQPPLLTALQNAQYSAACPLTLANAFGVCPAAATFGVDPNFRVGYVQSWNLKVQRDLPASLQINVLYLGNKGTRGVQLFLPNTYPAGALNPCPSCPSGFEYLTSTGDSTRESGQVQLRRRLRSGFTASVLYTYSKSIDDDSAFGGPGAAIVASASIAQNWRNLRGERGLSTFDQRHLLNATVQYTTGMGQGGGSLLSGWRGRVYKEWTVQTQINAGTGLPETPFASAIAIAGYSSVVRPNVTGQPLYGGTGGRFLNPAAFVTPAPGEFGNARRDSLTGPGVFSLNAGMVRTFRITSRYNLDAQLQSVNALNHVTYASWVTNVNSTQFGVPTAANAMRQVQVLLRLRF